MSTLSWIVFYAVVKNTPAWCEQKWPKTAVIFPLECNPRCWASVAVRFSVHTTQESVTKIYPICDDSFLRSTQRSIAPAPKSIRNRRFVCERKPYPICFFWCRHKSYPVWCRHSLSSVNEPTYLLRSLSHYCLLI